MTKAVRYLKANLLRAADGEAYPKELGVLLAENERPAGGLRRQNLDPGRLHEKNRSGNEKRPEGDASGRYANNYMSSPIDRI